MSRCFPGKIYGVTAPLPVVQWPYQIAYEWGAKLKSLLLQSTCTVERPAGHNQPSASH